ncbi:MAG: c-type cytochrome [Rhizobiaceae bacterium]
MSQKTIFKIQVSLVAILISGLAFAHTGAKGVVKERMDIMSDIGRSMKTIGQMIRSGEYDPKIAKQAALAIQEHASRIANLFPDGSIEEPSEALPSIWTNWDEFVAVAGKMDADAAQLARIAGNSAGIDDIKRQFRQLGKSCSGCHEKFRLKK